MINRSPEELQELRELVNNLNKDCYHSHDKYHGDYGFQPWTVENLLDGKHKCYVKEYTDNDLCNQCLRNFYNAYNKTLKKIYGLCEDCVFNNDLNYGRYGDIYMDRITIKKLYDSIDPKKLCDPCFLNYLINKFDNSNEIIELVIDRRDYRKYDISKLLQDRTAVVQ